MDDYEIGLWFAAVEVALRQHGDYSTDEAMFYGWWQEDLIGELVGSIPLDGAPLTEKRGT